MAAPGIRGGRFLCRASTDEHAHLTQSRLECRPACAL